MSPDKNRSAGPRVRLAIARWPDDAPRGAVTTFGAEQGIWRKDAPASCAGARRGEGPAAAGGPRSRRPRCRPEPPARSGSRPGPRCARGSGGARDWTTVRSACTTRWPPWALRRPRRRPWPGSSVRRGWPGPNRPRDRGRRGADSTRPAPNARRRARMPASTSWPAGARAVTWPAPGRPLPPGGGLAGRPGRWPARRPSTSSTRARPPGARTRRPRGRQRRGPGPQPAPSHRPPGGARALPGRRTPRRQSPCRPTTHGRQRALRPDPAPPPGPAAPGRLSRRAPGRRVDRFDHTLQHPAPPPGPARAHHPAAGLGRRRGRPGAPTGPRHRPHHPRRPNPRPPPAGRRPPHRRRPIAPSGQREAGHHPQRAPTTSAASRSRSAAPRPGTEPPRSATPPPSPPPTPTTGILIQYNRPPQGATRVSHHPPDPTNQRTRPRPQQAPTITEILTHRTSPMP